MQWVLIGLGAIIIVALGVYAGQLLSKLKIQNAKRQQKRDERLVNINQSIQTIAFAMQQQQCNFSEGAIRIFKILEGVPIIPLPDYGAQYPALFKLYEHVKELPTHDARNQLSKKERRMQDREREQQESELESQILHELESLREFTAK